MTLRTCLSLLLVLLMLPAATQAQGVIGPSLSDRVATGDQPAVPDEPSGARQGVIIHTDDAAALEAIGVTIEARFDGFVTARLTAEEIARVARVRGVRQLEDPVEFAHNDIAAALTGARALREGLLGGGTYTGAGVLVCVIDSGIDWQHGDFREAANPTTSRIVSIWDQTLTAQAGEAPPSSHGFTYGVEYTRAQIEAALTGGTVLRTRDTDGHGTHVAGTAAGNGASLTPAQHVGMAPEAELVIIKAGDGSYPTSNVVDGISYCDKVATAQGKPAVVNMSLGSDSGPHDGTDAKSVAVTNFGAKAGRVAVQSAGNSGANLIHASATIGAGSIGTVTLTVPTYSPSASTDNFGVDVWFDTAPNVTVTVTTPNGHTATQAAGGAAYTSTPDGRVYLFNYLDANNLDRRVYVTVDDASGAEPAAGTWTIRLTNNAAAADGYHAWLFDPSITGATVTMSGANSQYTVSNAATGGITVGSYVHRWRWSPSGGGAYGYTGTERSDGLSSFSSQGPARDGATMPHLTAPGQAMASSLSRDALVSSSNTLTGGQHHLTQGTSMSSPVVAGLAALLLQHDPTLTGTQVREAFATATDVDAFTGAVPNNLFGAGKINAYAALARLASGTSTPGFRVMAYDGAPTSSAGINGGQALSMQFTHALGHEGRVRGVLFHPSSTVASSGTLTVRIHADDGAGNPGVQIGTSVAVDMARVNVYTWNYADLSSATADVLSGTPYHVVLALSSGSGTTYFRHDNSPSGAGRSLINAGSGWSAQSFDWGVRPLVSSGAGALPVELAVFEGVTEGRRAVLTWLTASETNNAGFHVDVRREGGTWHELGFVAGQGTTTEATRYAFTTDELVPGVHRFRLRQVDFDGAVTESGVVEVAVEAAAALTVRLDGPHPSAGGVRVAFTLPRSGKARVALYDLLGREVAVLFDGTAEAGAVNHAASGSGLASGVYVVRIVQDGAQQTARVVVAQ